MSGNFGLNVAPMSGGIGAMAAGIGPAQGSGGTPFPPGTTLEQVVQAVYADLVRRQQGGGRLATGGMGMAPASAAPSTGTMTPAFATGGGMLAGAGLGWSSTQPAQGPLSAQSIWGDIGAVFSDAGKTIINTVGQQVAQRLPDMIGGLLQSLAASPEFAQYAQQVRVQSAGPGGALTPQFDFGGFLRSAAGAISQAVTQYVVPNLPTIVGTIASLSAQPQIPGGQVPQAQQPQPGQASGFLH